MKKLTVSLALAATVAAGSTIAAPAALAQEQSTPSVIQSSTLPEAVEGDAPQYVKSSPATELDKFVHAASHLSLGDKVPAELKGLLEPLVQIFNFIVGLASLPLLIGQLPFAEACNVVDTRGCAPTS